MRVCMIDFVQVPKHAHAHPRTRIYKLESYFPHTHLFGLSTFLAEERNKEIGIRKVLGASISKIIQTLSKEFILLIIIANVLAWLPAWYYLNRWLDTFTFRTSLNWWLFLIAGIISLTIALFIVGLQSYLVGSKNPVEAIKAE